MTSPILIGESNPYGADPEMALYPLPPRASGGRLRRLVFGIRLHRYVALRRHNLVDGKWSVPVARQEARRLVQEYTRIGSRAIQDRHQLPEPAVFVLLGRKVAKAFGLDAHPPFVFVRTYAADPAVERDPIFLLLPHPSGLNRQWQEPGAYGRARELLRVVCPDVPWGEIDG